MDEGGAEEIARRCRGTPRVVNRLLRRARDFAEVRANGLITRAVAQEALAMLGVDESGLDEVDRNLMVALLDKYGGGPVGLGTLAASLSEEEDAIEEMYEPYLMQLGMIDRTPRGRVATARAYEYLKRESPKRQPGINRAASAHVATKICPHPPCGTRAGVAASVVACDRKTNACHSSRQRHRASVSILRRSSPCLRQAGCAPTRIRIRKLRSAARCR